MPAAVPIAMGAVSIGTSVIQGISANKRAREIQRQIDNYKRQDLVNPNLSLQVSTLGADRQREDLARTMSTMVNQAAMGGSRSILGLAPGMIAQQNAQEAQIMAQLDEQERQRQIAVAQGDAMVQQMQEQREQQDLMGLGNALNTARHEATNAWNNAIQSGISTASMAMEHIKNNPTSANAETSKAARRIKEFLPGADISYNPLQPINTGFSFENTKTPLFPNGAPYISPNVINLTPNIKRKR